MSRAKELVRAATPVGVLDWWGKRLPARQAALLGSLREENAGLLQSFRDAPAQELRPIGADYPVWVCWWQGEEQMPELIRVCYRQLLRNAGTHPVRLITSANWGDYVQLDPQILRRVEAGQISITHLSDILRSALLADHGGWWLDATLFTLGPLPEFGADDTLFSIRRVPQGKNISAARWTTYCLAAGPGNPLPEFLRAAFAKYWEHHDKLLDYTLIDYVIALAHDELPTVAGQLDSLPFSNPNVRWLLEHLDEPYHPGIFAHLQTANSFVKLNWRKVGAGLRDSVDQKPTYWGKLKALAAGD